MTATEANSTGPGGSHRSRGSVIVSHDTRPSGTASAGAPTLAKVREKRHMIIGLAEGASLENVRVVGSVARGDSTPASDIDLIVDPKPGASLLDLAQFADHLEKLLGYPVDVLSARSLDPETDAPLLADAVPL